MRPRLSPKADSLSIRDNRTGSEYEIAITDGTIRAADLKQIAVEAALVGNYDPGFVSTASCRSAITYIDGEQGILGAAAYRSGNWPSIPPFWRSAYLLIHGELPTRPTTTEWVHSIAIPVHSTRTSSSSSKASATARIRWGC